MRKVDVQSNEAQLTEDELRALIPQLQQITEKYKRAERIQKALLDISELASTVSHLSKLYPAIHEIIGEFMNVDNFYVAYYDRAENQISFAYFVDEMDEKLVGQIPSDKLFDGITGYIIKTGQSVFLSSEEFIELQSSRGIELFGNPPEYLLGVPLKRGNQVIGAMVTQTYDPQVSYSQEDLEVLSFVSQHIVTTVDRVKRSEVTERTIRERTRQLREMNDDLQEEILERQKVESLQQALFEISELAAMLGGDMDTFYSQLHEILSRLLSAPNCYIAIIDKQRQYLEFPYYSDTAESAISERPLGLGLTEFVIRSGQAEMINPARVLDMAEMGTLDVSTAQSMLNKSTTWLGSPLIVEGEVAGVIAVQSYGSQAKYSSKDLELLKFVSHHIASAMERKKRADAIRQYNLELEQRVLSRTEELDNANQILKKQIEQRKEIELKLIHDAHHDNLTDLPNRAMFNSRLELAIASKHRRPEKMYAVLFIDLDRFKLINDTLGHLAGDRFLVEVSHRIAMCIRGHDLLARLGGDEFVVLLDNFADNQDAEEVATRIIDSVSQPFDLDGRETYSSASIGITHIEPYYREADEVLRDADAAMYQAKALGRGRFVMFDKSMREQLLEEIELEGELRKYMRESAFGKRVQPVLTLSSQTAIYHELFLRWEHPEFGVIPREQFRQVAEQSGLLLDLDVYQLELACKYLKDHANTVKRIGVNVSIHHLLQNSLVNKIVDLIVNSGTSPEQFVFEFDENDLNRRSQFILPAIKKLKRAGITLVLDNFGSGLASLSYLFSYPFDFIKIDHRFIRSLPRSQRNLKLIQSVMLISEHLHYKVIANGIVNQAQLDELVDIGCQFGQGTLIAEPNVIEPGTLLDH